MKYLLIICTLFISTSCTQKIANNYDNKLEIDIYRIDITYEKFKQHAIKYAEQSSYPRLTKNDQK
tara:strand:- start:10184 stop:10378 length:195 start_codon:yes stop_codon:yes gene_type:complete